MMSLVIIKWLKVKIFQNESVKDQTRCPAIQGFVRLRRLERVSYTLCTRQDN